MRGARRCHCLSRIIVARSGVMVAPVHGRVRQTWTRTKGALTEPRDSMVGNCQARLGGPGISHPAGDDVKARVTEERKAKGRAGKRLPRSGLVQRYVGIRKDLANVSLHET